MSACANVTFLKGHNALGFSSTASVFGRLLTARMLSTHPRIGHADYPGVAADHQEDEAEQRHVPSANEQTRVGRKETTNEQYIQ